MASIQARRTDSGKVKYRALVRLRGYPAQSATFERKTDARRWAQQTEAAIREGRFFRTSEAQRHTLANLIDRYVADVIPTKGKNGPKQLVHLRWWREEIGERLLVDVTPALIAECRDRLLRRVKSSTTNRYLAALSPVYTIAVREWGWVRENPVRNVRRLPEPRGRVRFLDDAERRRLLEASRASALPALYPIVLLAITTGARKAEILGLRWKDVDLHRGLLRLEETKNNERRAVPLVGEARDQVKTLSKVRRIDTDLVFPSSTGKRPVYIEKHWRVALTEAGIDDFVFHDLRHTAASYLAMSGATLAEIAEVLGHKTLVMVKRYSHLTDQHTTRVVERMYSQFLA